ncbi:winged helix-turn-helix transcriptional regulator [Buchananella hordeovulneris]|uniref:winged helix-turn-helix transcriptional regulator n=1 Tax=Buchananella hordeovulneris TaxID=52770 RepID=UPI000F5FEBC0|nr:helix-turn-helix domain-containing protein [Buchananella hordeovulneris]RRD45327.1 transcriptional regulator [Buchananella hordeovulneris]
MSSRRSYSSYNDGCAAAHALDIIGERWSLIVVRELLLGPKRFAELQRDVLGISPTLLSRRLRDLESRGIVVRSTLPAPAKVEVYELTPWGLRLEAVNKALSMWAVASPNFPWEADMSPDALVLAMRAHARANTSLRSPVRVNLHLCDSRRPDPEPVAYSAIMTRQDTLIEKAPTPPSAAAQVHATTAAWKSCLIGGGKLDDLEDIRITGSSFAVEALIATTNLAGNQDAHLSSAPAPTNQEIA